MEERSGECPMGAAPEVGFLRVRKCRKLRACEMVAVLIVITLASTDD